jgi:hypothetical protein|tara:strand:+ start:12586 stop:12957 length:372 start_codon:yes stop_codon:yes gene_type:complete
VRRARNRLLVSAIDDASFRRHADPASARFARARGEDVVRVAVDAGARENARARGERGVENARESRVGDRDTHPGTDANARRARVGGDEMARERARVRSPHVGVRGDVSAGRVRAGGGSRAGDE